MKKILTYEQRFSEINLMRKHFATVMSELIEKNSNIALLLADITVASFEEVAKKHPDRVINVGIREQLMIDMAGGFALSGMRPIAHTFASFLVERPFEQIKIALNHQNVGAVLVSAGASYDLAVDGRTHQAPADVALLGTLSGWNIYIPGHVEEAERALRLAVAGKGLDYIRLATESNSQAYWNGEESFVVLKSGRSGTVIAVGPVADRVLEAVDSLDVTVLYAPIIRPFDKKTLLATLSKPSIALVEPYLVGTSSYYVSDTLTDIPHRLLSIGVELEEHRKFGMPEEHCKHHGLDTLSLKNKLTSFFEK